MDMETQMHLLRPYTNHPDVGLLSDSSKADGNAVSLNEQESLAILLPFCSALGRSRAIVNKQGHILCLGPPYELTGLLQVHRWNRVHTGPTHHKCDLPLVKKQVSH